MDDTRTVVLVEGVSDKTAVDTLAGRQGRDLAAEGVRVLAMGGATNISKYARRFGPAGAGLRLAGLCDAAEEGEFRRGLARAGLGDGELSTLGFFICVTDLEDELLRALGTAGAERVVEAEGDLRAFHTLRRQPEWRCRDTHDQLRRFLSSGAGRKIRYARALVTALEPGRVPRPLDRLLARSA